MIRALIFPFVLIATAAVAQQQPAQPPASPMEQVMANKLLLEIQAGLQCSANWLSTQRSLDAATAELEKRDATIKSLSSQLEEFKKSPPKIVPPLATPIPKAENLTPPVDMAPNKEEPK